MVLRLVGCVKEWVSGGVFMWSQWDVVGDWFYYGRKDGLSLYVTFLSSILMLKLSRERKTGGDSRGVQINMIGSIIELYFQEIFTSIRPAESD